MSNIQSINEYCDTLIKSKRYDIMNEGIISNYIKSKREKNEKEKQDQNEKRILNRIITAKNFWDTGDKKYTDVGDDCFITFDALDITIRDIINHFRNSKGITKLEDIINHIYKYDYEYENMDNKEREESLYTNNMKKTDKAILLASDTAFNIVFNYSINKMVIFHKYFPDIINATDIFEYTGDSSNVDSKLYIEIANKNNIEFK